MKHENPLQAPFSKGRSRGSARLYLDERALVLKKRILMVTGEVSGDLHGAHLARELLECGSDLELSGIGGQYMARAGVNILFPSYKLSVIGLSGIFRKILLFRKAYRLVVKELARDDLAALILIDFPGFNLFLARKAKGLGIPVIYYIGPQVWAWRKGRLKKIAGRVDLMIVILPFEEEIYQKAGIPVKFVGHPLADIISIKRKREEVCRDYHFDGNHPIIGLLPGSRRSEIERILPVMLKASERIHKKIPEAQFFILAAPGTEDNAFINRKTPPGVNGGAQGQGVFSAALFDRMPGVKVIPKSDYDLMSQADFLMIASGTATLEAAMLGVPFIIVYLTDWLTYFLAKLFVKIPYIGLVNVMAKRFVVPEFIQGKANPGTLAEGSLEFLLNPTLVKDVRKELQNVCRTIRSGGVSARAAKEVLEFLLISHTRSGGSHLA